MGGGEGLVGANEIIVKDRPCGKAVAAQDCDGVGDWLPPVVPARQLPSGPSGEQVAGRGGVQPGAQPRIEHPYDAVRQACPPTSIVQSGSVR